MYHGDIALGSTIDIKFTTRRFSTGAPYALASGTVVAYPDNSTTEITAGITLTADFDSRTGLNNVRVVATSGNGYATATNYTLVLSAGTVDSVSVVGECVGSFSIENRSGLRPTTAGRTLDVSTGGEAGLDWANIGSPTTTQNLSATTVKTATDVETDTADIQSRLPAALVSGRIDASVGAMAANVVTAAAIATDAIDADALAADAGTEIGTAVWATTTRVLTANTNLNDPTAAAIADAVWDELATGHTDAGKAGQQLWTDIDDILTDTSTTLQGELDGIQADTEDIQARLPAALVSGRIDASVGAMAAGVVTAAAVATNAIDADALAADAVTEIQSGLATAASIAALNDLSAAEVNAEVVDALATDTYGESGSVVAATSSLAAALVWLKTLARNKITQTATTQTLRNDADSGNIATATVSDDGSTYTRGEWT